MTVVPSAVSKPPLPGGVAPVGAMVWVMAICGAFALGVEQGLMLGLGYVSQWAVKAPKNIQDWQAAAIMVGACLTAYSILHHEAGLWFREPWIQACAVWSLAAFGAGSLAGHTGGAPGTNKL